jgi:hypothetical protein
VMEALGTGKFVAEEGGGERRGFQYAAYVAVGATKFRRSLGAKCW